MERTSTSADDVFEPSAPALRETASAIRALLGDWPPAAARWRFRAMPTPPTTWKGERGGERKDEEGADGTEGAENAQGMEDAPPRTAWIVASPSNGERLDDWRRDGATVIDVSGASTLLIADGERYRFGGPRRADWLAALAAFVDCGFALRDALCLALAWRGPGEVAQAAEVPDAGPGEAADATAPDAAVPRLSAHWPARLADFPDLPDLPERARPFPSCPSALGLYPIVPDADWVARLIALGVRTVQLRLKTADPVVLRGEIARAVAAARRAPDEVRLFINDHWRLAIDAGAYGVHLGQEDLVDADLDAIAAAGLRLGLSTHGYYEILRAWRVRPSYIACGAVFATATKVVRTPPQGLLRIAAYQRLLAGAVPVVAIGGIDRATLPAVLATGVGGAAVVSAVTRATDVAATVDALRAVFHA